MIMALFAFIKTQSGIIITTTRQNWWAEPIHLLLFFVFVFCFCLSSHCWLKSEIPSRDVSLLIDLRKKRKEKHQCDWLIISPRSAFLPSFLLSINHPPTPPSPGGRCSNPLIGFLLYDSASSQEQREHHQSSSRSRVASQPDGNQTFYFIFLVLGNPLF